MAWSSPEASESTTPPVAPRSSAGCRWLGLELDEARNASGAGRISSESSRVSAWVIPTDEEGMIARHTAAVLAKA